MKNSASFPDSHAAVHAAAALIREARYLTAFTGAGISVESGIPPFRGPGGLWGKYDPETLHIDYFLAHPEKAWPVIKEIFYDHFGTARPNRAHEVLAAWEEDRVTTIRWTEEEVSAWWDSRADPPPENAKPGPCVDAQGTGRTAAKNKHPLDTESAPACQALPNGRGA